MKNLIRVSLILMIPALGFGQAITDDGTNVGIGNASPLHRLDVSGDINIATGNALLIGGNQVVSTAGSRNMFLGDGTGTNITSGGDNAIIGFKAGEQLATGRFNTLIGFKAGQYMVSSLSNTIIGREAGLFNSGNQNVLIGRESGKLNQGDENVFIGDRVGLGNSIGTTNTLIGSNSNVGSGGLTNSTAIGAGAIVNSSNSLILGNNANVGIGTSTPTYDLDVVGDINYTGDLYQNGVLLAAGATGPTGADGPAGANGANGADGATGPTGPLASGTSSQTLRHDGVDWAASSAIQNDGSRVGINTAPSLFAPFVVENSTDQYTAKFIHTSSGATPSPSVAVEVQAFQDPGGFTNTTATYNRAEASSTNSGGVTGLHNLMVGDGSVGTGFVRGTATYFTADLVGMGKTLIGNYVFFNGIPGANEFAFYAENGKSHFGGNVGIGQTAPAYDLDVNGDINFTGNLYDNGVLFSGPTGPIGSNGATGPTGPSGSNANAIFDLTLGVTSNANGNYNSDDFVFGSSQLDDAGNTNHDSRFFFNKSKSAFRAGSVIGTQWDAANVGDHSTAFGFGSIASGNSSVAIGSENTTSGDYSITLGALNVASGQSSTAFGISSTASAGGSTAFGAESIASGLYSIAAGFRSEASGRYSTSIGTETLSRSGYETVIGRFNTDYTPATATGWASSDRLLTVGNGTSSGARSNALILYKDGRLTINDNYTLPGGSGLAGTVLTSDGAGNVSWAYGTPGPTGPIGPTGVDGPTGPQGPTGALPLASANETLRFDGANWVSNNVLNNDGTDLYTTGVLRVGGLVEGEIAGNAGNFELLAAGGHLRLQTNGVAKNVTVQNDPAVSPYATFNGNNENLLLGTTGNFGNTRLRVVADGLFAAYFSADSLDGATHVIKAEFTGTGNTHAEAVYADSRPADGYGVGVDSYGGHTGVKGTGDGGANAGSVYGGNFNATGSAGNRYAVRGGATGTGTNNYAVFGFASGATNDWAGYFSSGNVYVADKRSIGTTSTTRTFNVEASEATAGEIENTFSSVSSITALKVTGENTSTGSATGLLSIATSNGPQFAWGSWSSAEASTGGKSYGVYGTAIGGVSQCAGYFTGDVYSSGSFNTSDRKLKKDISEISGAAEIIDQLIPQTYQFKTDKYDYMHLQKGQRYGFIADELKEVLPQFVKTTYQPIYGPNDVEFDNPDFEQALEFESVNYVELIPILTAALQETRAELQEKDDRVTELESQMKKVLDRLSEFDTDLQQCCFNFEDGQQRIAATMSGVEKSDSPILEQNQPNPFRENSVIKYYLPEDTKLAQLVISDLNGVEIRTFDLQGKGFGQVLISGGSFKAGTYLYTLTINGNRIDSKRMMLL